MTIVEKQLLKAGPTARKLGIPVSWLKAEAGAGKLPHIRAGKILLFDPQKIERILIKRAQVEGVSNK